MDVLEYILIRCHCIFLLYINLIQESICEENKLMSGSIRQRCNCTSMCCRYLFIKIQKLPFELNEFSYQNLHIVIIICICLGVLFLTYMGILHKIAKHLHGIFSPSFLNFLTLVLLIVVIHFDLVRIYYINARKKF